MDYGTINVTLHRGLSLDQKMTMIKNAVENQLFTRNRNHYNEILDQCIAISKIIDDGIPVVNRLNNYIYKYSFFLNYYY